MRTFYQFILKYRGELRVTEKGKLADWIFYDHDFPKHLNSYHEISDYLEWNSPFADALVVFDELWAVYEEEK